MRERQTSSLDIYSFGVVLLEVWGCFRGTKTPTELSREGLQPIIWKEALNFLPGQHEANFLRRMISRNPTHRPTAIHCLQFLTGNVAHLSRETLRTETNPKTIPETDKEIRQLHDPEKSPHDDISQLRVHSQVKPRFQPHKFPSRYPRTGLVDNLATATRPQQVSPIPEVRPGAAARLQRRTKAEGLQVDDLIPSCSNPTGDKGSRSLAEIETTLDKTGQNRVEPNQT